MRIALGMEHAVGSRGGRRAVGVASALALVLVAACGGPARPVPVAAVARPAPGPSFLVASQHGVIEVDTTGTELGVWSRRPARWVGAGRSGRVVAGDETGALWIVDPARGDRMIATVRTQARCPDAGDQPIGISSHGFGVSADGRFACALLEEYEYDAAVHIGTVVDLTTGQVYEDPHACDAPRPPPPPGAGCGGDLPAAADDDDAAPPAEEPERRTMAGIEFRKRSVSPSGRWQLWKGDVYEGSTLYDRHALVEVATGRIWMVPDRGGAWPAALDLAKLPANLAGEPDLDETARRNLGGWVSYTLTVEWLPGDVLHVGHLLLHPGVRTVELPGMAIRTPPRTID